MAETTCSPEFKRYTHAGGLDAERAQPFTTYELVIRSLDILRTIIRVVPRSAAENATPCLQHWVRLKKAICKPDLLSCLTKLVLSEYEVISTEAIKVFQFKTLAADRFGCRR